MSSVRLALRIPLVCYTSFRPKPGTTHWPGLVDPGHGTTNHRIYQLWRSMPIRSGYELATDHSFGFFWAMTSQVIVFKIRNRKTIRNEDQKYTDHRNKYSCSTYFHLDSTYANSYRNSSTRNLTNPSSNADGPL